MIRLFAVFGAITLVSCEATVDNRGNYFDTYTFSTNERVDSLLKEDFYRIHSQFDESSIKGNEIYRLTVAPSFSPPFVIKTSKLPMDTLYEVQYKSLMQSEAEGLIIIEEHVRKVISRNDISKLRDGFQEIMLDKISSNKECDGADGTYYLIEYQFSTYQNALLRFAPEHCGYDDSELFISIVNEFISLSQVEISKPPYIY